MNNDLQTKLQQFSAEPPAGAWDKIAGALDSEGSFAARLFSYEEVPPAANWQKIEQGLATQPEKAKVVPLRKSFTRPMRYIAAASILVVALVTITLTTERTEAGALEPDGTTVSPAANIPASTSTTQPIYPETTGTAGNADVYPADLQAKRKSVSNRRSFSTSPVNAVQNDYVSYSDGSGKVMKVARKMETYINCKDGDWQCKQRLQELRQKMAAKAMTTDFTGILEMLQQLQ
ncbi:MAG: hypothetical protein EOO14_24585 [Chitinophagaceae bacterium]|nr:MAG: hypothetical protein EOO14_24585 [Chitinophagaceae bacterium]